MRPGASSLFFAVALGAALGAAAPAWARNTGDYDDFSNFSSDPQELDEEVAQIFGRFFQTSFHVGTGILTSGLGQAHSAGIELGLQFIYYFDKAIGVQMGVGYMRNSGRYQSSSPSNSAQLVDFDHIHTMVPINLGIRYGFNRESLSRGFALMNPYFFLNGLAIFRNEQTPGDGVRDQTGMDTSLQATFGPDASYNTFAFGVDFGAGIMFDVYRDRIFLGLDARYRLIFFPDENLTIGRIAHSGDAISIVGTITYNY